MRFECALDSIQLTHSGSDTYLSLILTMNPGSGGCGVTKMYRQLKTLLHRAPCTSGAASALPKKSKATRKPQESHKRCLRTANKLVT